MARLATEVAVTTLAFVLVTNTRKWSSLLDKSIGLSNGEGIRGTDSDVTECLGRSLGIGETASRRPLGRNRIILSPVVFNSHIADILVGQL
jgi:hypothetical protein